MYQQNPCKKNICATFPRLPQCRHLLFRPSARRLAEYHPRKHDSTIQPSLKYNKVKLPEYLVSEEIIRNTSGGRRGGMVNGKKR